MIRVLIADDQLGMRHGIRSMLADFPDIEVVGEAGSGPEAVQLTAEVHPDVVVMDVRMPGGDGITATRQLAGTGVAVVVMTTFDLDEYVLGALEAGASGFMLKNGDADELAASVRAALRGDAMVSPSVTRRFFTRLTQREPVAPPSPGPDAPREVAYLTERELSVVRAAARGLSNAQIATEFHLGIGTVKGYMRHIMAKTRTGSRTELIAWAYQRGLGE